MAKNLISDIKDRIKPKKVENPEKEKEEGKESSLAKGNSLTSTAFSDTQNEMPPPQPKER